VSAFGCGFAAGWVVVSGADPQGFAASIRWITNQGIKGYNYTTKTVH